MRIVRRDERLFTVQDRRIARTPVVPLTHSECLEVNGHSFGQGGMRVRVEVGIRKVGDPRLSGVELDDVRALHTTDVAPSAALVQPKQRRKPLERALMDVDRGRSDLTDTGRLR